jgi:hypothetical protein
VNRSVFYHLLSQVIMYKSEMKAVRTTKIPTIVGSLLIAASLLVLIGWVGTGDPDCYYTTEMFAQYRYCGKEYVDEENTMNHTIPLAAMVSLFAGLLLVGLGKRSKDPEDKESNT